MPGRGEAGANPRFVVTSLKPREIAARPLHEKLYCARGDMEHRIKECQLDLFADRTSAATMRANQLRLWFASMAYALLSALRRRALAHTELARATCGTIRAKLLKIGAGDCQCPAGPRRHGLRLSLRRRLPSGASPIMRLTRRRPARAAPRNPANPAAPRPQPGAADPRVPTRTSPPDMQQSR
jgi:hypothetical protein